MANRLLLASAFVSALMTPYSGIHTERRLHSNEAIDVVANYTINHPENITLDSKEYCSTLDNEKKVIEISKKCSEYERRKGLIKELTGAYLFLNNEPMQDHLFNQVVENTYQFGTHQNPSGNWMSIADAVLNEPDENPELSTEDILDVLLDRSVEHRRDLPTNGQSCHVLKYIAISDGHIVGGVFRERTLDGKRRIFIHEALHTLDDLHGKKTPHENIGEKSSEVGAALFGK